MSYNYNAFCRTRYTSLQMRPCGDIYDFTWPSGTTD